MSSLRETPPAMRQMLIIDLDGDGFRDLVLAEIEAEIKYAGYIARQDREVERLRRMEDKRIPAHFDYGGMEGLWIEARDALLGRQPLTLGEASRVPGVRATDLNLLLTKVAAGGLRLKEPRE